jgi:hypothetical protein
VLIRAERLLGEPETDRRRASFQATSASWTISPLGPEIITRARKPFPAEPIRTLGSTRCISPAPSTSPKALMIWLC